MKTPQFPRHLKVKNLDNSCEIWEFYQDTTGHESEIEEAIVAEMLQI